MQNKRGMLNTRAKKIINNKRGRYSDSKKIFKGVWGWRWGDSVGVLFILKLQNKQGVLHQHSIKRRYLLHKVIKVPNGAFG